jgi:eukaryotic-like serine/threonine-protein kinase
MTSCPSDEQFGAYLGGNAELAIKAAIAEHIDECDECRQLVVAAVQATPSRHLTTLAVGSQPTAPGADRGSDRSVKVGDQLGRYQLIELIGVGGMGQVFLARDLELLRDIALKVLRPGLEGSAEVLTARLLRESRLMARLSHPGVISVYDVGRHGGLVFVAMELIRGVTLTQWLRGERRKPTVAGADDAANGERGAPPAVTEVLATFVAAGRGLIAAHQAGLVHRDFKPDNVLVALEESRGAGGARRARVARVVVTDFGVARALTLGPSRPAPFASALSPGMLDGLTKPGSTVGTPAYMAPEQLQGLAVDQRADVFAFAASLWEALWTSRPFPGRTLVEISEAMGRPPVRGAARGHVPRRVAKALGAALQIEADQRTRSLAPLLEVIDPARAKRRRAIALAVAAAAVTAVVAAGAGHLVTPRRHVIERVVGGSADPCQADREQIEAAVTSERLASLQQTLVAGGATAEVAKQVRDALADAAETWKATALRVCTSNRDSTAIACLHARRTELLGVSEDLREERALQASAEHYVHFIGDARLCAQATTSQQFSRIPADPALRAPVRQLRARILAANQAPDERKREAVLVELRAVRAAAEPLWPILFAEALCAEGSAELQAGDSRLSTTILKQAAAIAEKTRYDQIALEAWTQLVAGATFTEHEFDRAFEYATYANAALDRLGRPPSEEIHLLYYWGGALVQADRPTEGEAKLKRALELAEQHERSRVPMMTQGLAFFYDQVGEFAKAIAMYRRAIAASQGAPQSVLAGFRASLALDLAIHGDRAAALEEAIAARAAAKGSIGPRNSEWQTIDFAHVLALRQLGRFDEALEVLAAAQAKVMAVGGARSPEAAEFHQLQARLLADAGHLGEAMPLIARACEAIAFTENERSLEYAACLADQAQLELRSDRVAKALEHIEKAISIGESVGWSRPDIAVAYQVRGEARRSRGDQAGAAADFDRAIKLATADADPGYLASARLAKARSLITADRAAAIALVRAAIAAWRPDPGLWRRELHEAETVLAKLGRAAPGR